MIYAADPAISTTTIQKTGVETNFNSLNKVFTAAINLVLGVGIALTVIFLILGGIKYITSRGDPKGTQAARDSLTNAVIGFIIVIGAFAIKAILGNLLAANVGGVNGVIGNL